MEGWKPGTGMDALSITATRIEQVMGPGSFPITATPQNLYKFAVKKEVNLAAFNWKLSSLHNH